jgi:hypothetical protein
MAFILMNGAFDCSGSPVGVDAGPIGPTGW